MEKQNDSIGTCTNEESAFELGWRRPPISRWFERLLAELGFELWIGDPAEIAAKRVKKRKTDVRRADLNPTRKSRGA